MMTPPPSSSYIESCTKWSLISTGVGYMAGCGALAAQLYGRKVTSGALFGAFGGAVQGAIIGLWQQVFGTAIDNGGYTGLGLAVVAGPVAHFGGTAASWQLCKSLGYDIGGYGDALNMQGILLLLGLLGVGAVGAGLLIHENLCRSQEPVAPAV